MKPGREADAIVAEKVMGHTVEWGKTWTLDDWSSTDNCTEEHGPGIPRGQGMHIANPPRESVPEYSTDIAAAWEVVEKVEATGRWLWLSRGPGGWIAAFSAAENQAVPLHAKASASTAPLAICLAALSITEHP